MTWNTGGVGAWSSAFRQYMQAVRPDLIRLQAAGAPAGPDVRPGRAVAGGGGGPVVRTPRLAARRGRVTAAGLGAPGSCSRVALEIPVGPIVVVNVHLPTSRPEIEAVLRYRLSGAPELEEITRARGHAPAAVADWEGPQTDGLIGAGDFNMPAESVIFRRDLAGFGNVLSAAGTGWGTTKQTSWFGTRMDHVQFAPPWRCRAVRTDPAVGSDHRPVIADLVYAVE